MGRITTTVLEKKQAAGLTWETEPSTPGHKQQQPNCSSNSKAAAATTTPPPPPMSSSASVGFVLFCLEERLLEHA